MSGYVVSRRSYRGVLIQQALPRLRKLRDDIGKDMERLVPVLTGELRNSLFCHLDETTGRITAGAYAEHASFVEHGTSRMHAQPYVRPALYRRRS